MRVVVAGKVSKILNIIIATKGARDSEDALNRITKAQTRLGQSSVSAGRSFSSQAQGLGGLVGIYAAAAATVYALEAAFTALNNAAAAENIVKGTNTLAAVYGQAGPKILKNIKEITSGQLTMADAAGQANLALAAGFSGTQLEKLTVIAAKASRALGRDLTDSMNRIVRGSVKMEAELLDELGIFTKIGPATSAYAKQLGVATSALTDFERRQAFLNAVTEEGLRKYQAIDTTVRSTQKTLKQLVVSLQELGTAFLQTVGNAIEPFVSFIKNTAGAEMLAFAGVMLLVFSKLLQGIGSLVQGGINKLQTFTTVLSGISQSLTAAPSRLEKTSALFNKFIDRRGGIVGTGKDSASGGSFAKGLKREESQAATAARNRFMSGNIPALGSEQRAADIRALTIAQQKLLTVTDKNGVAIRANSLAYKDASRILRIYAADTARTTRLTSFLNRAVTGMTSVVRLASMAFAGFSALLSGIAIIISAIQITGLITGNDYLGNFIKKTKEAKEALARLDAGISGSAFFAAGGSSNVKGRLELLGLTEDQIGESGEKLVSTAKTVYSRTLGALAKTTRRGTKQFVNDPILMRSKQIVMANKMIQEAQEKLANTPFSNILDRQEIKTDIVLLEAVREKLISLGTGYDSLVGEIAQPLGLNTEDVIATITDISNIPNAIQKTTKQVAGASRDTISIFGQIIPVLSDGSMTLEGLTEKQKDYVLNGVSVLNVMKNLKKDFNSGSISLDEYTARLTSANNTLSEMKKIIPQGLYSLFFKDADLAISQARTIQESFRAIATLNKGVQAQFSSAIQESGKFAFTGLMDLSGNLAKDNNKQLENQLTYLDLIIKATDKIIAKNSQDVEASDLNLQSRRALTGLLIQNVQQIVSALDNQKKISKQLNNQLRVLKLQNALQKAQVAMSLKQINNKSTIDRLQQELKLEELKLQNSKTQNTLSYQNQQNTLKALEKQKNLYADILKASLSISKSTKEFASTVYKVQALQATPTNTSGGANIAYINELNKANDFIIQGQQDIINQTLRTQDLQNALKQQQIQEERNIIKERLAVFATTNEDELTALKNRQNIETKKIENEISILKDEKNLLKIKKDIDLISAKTQKDIQIEQLKNVQRLLKAFNILNNAINLFALSVTDLGSIASKIDPTAMAGFQAVAKPADFMKSAEQLRAELQNQLISDANTVNQIYIETRDQVIDINNLERSGLQARINSLLQQKTLNEQIFAEERQQLSLRQQQDMQSLKNRLQELSFVPDMSGYVEVLDDIRLKASDVITKFGDMSASARQATAELKNELADIQIKAQLDRASFNRDMALLKQEAALEVLQLRVELVQAKVSSKTLSELEGAKQENALQKEILSKREELITLEYQNTLAANQEQRELLADQLVRDLQAVENRKAALIAEINRDESYITNLASTFKTNIEEQQSVYSNFFAGLTSQWNNIFDAFAKTGNRVAEALKSGIIAGTTGGDITAATGAKAVKGTFDQISSGLDAVVTQTTIAAANARQDVATEALSRQAVLKATHSAEMERLAREDEKAEEVFNNKLTALDLQKQIENENSKARIQGAGEEKKALTGRLAEIQSSIAGSLSSAMMSLNDFIVYGEGTLREALGGFFRSIQESILEKTIVEPLANKMSHWLTGAINQMVGGEDITGAPLSASVGGTLAQPDTNVQGLNAFAAGGTAMTNLGTTIAASAQQAVAQINMAGQQIGQAMSQLGIKTQTSTQAAGSQAAASGMGLSTQIQTTGQTVAQGTIAAGAAVGSAGTAFTTMLQSFWPILLMMGITALINKKSSGGIIKRAAGGGVQKLAAGGVSLRDRVPALLEPGEFVIRKPAARKIGAPALHQLNATGQMGAASGNIQVNVKNEGSPKEATTAQPKFDGEKYIIDVITRDLSNNGPIRRSLRGNR